jgi:uncharacterized protein (UPF0212 family)
MRKCPACDKDIEAGWVACPHCGVKLEGEAAVADPEYGTLERVVETVMDKREAARRSATPAVVETPIPAKKHWTEVFTGD